MYVCFLRSFIAFERVCLSLYHNIVPHLERYAFSSHFIYFDSGNVKDENIKTIH